MLWKRTKEHGLPFDIGWADHPAWMTDIIFTLDDEYASWLKSQGEDRGER